MTNENNNQDKFNRNFQFPEERIVRSLYPEEVKEYKEHLISVLEDGGHAPILLIIFGESNKEDVDFFLSHGVKNVNYISSINEGLWVLIDFLTKLVTYETTETEKELRRFNFRGKRKDWMWEYEKNAI